jgi:hypothetical protein
VDARWGKGFWLGETFTDGGRVEALECQRSVRGTDAIAWYADNIGRNRIDSKEFLRADPAISATGENAVRRLMGEHGGT